MKSRVALIAIAILILALVGFFIARRGTEKLPPDRVHDVPRKIWPPGANPPRVELTEVDVDPAVSRQERVTATRRAMARGLAYMSIRWTSHWAIHLESMHGGACPEFRDFARDFIAAAGSDLIPIVKSMLADCASEEAKFLLVSVLGEARRPEAVAILKELLAQSPGFNVAASALHSIGMSRGPDALQFLTSWLDSYRTGESKDHGHLLVPALSAIGQCGGEAFDFLLAEARKRGAENYPSAADILGGIRGNDAFDKLRRLYETETDWSLRHGAARAMGFTADPVNLAYWMARSEPGLAGLALLAPRNVPDVWNATAQARRDAAESLLTASGIPSGDPKRDVQGLYLAALLPPDRARPLYESLAGAVRPDQGPDARHQIQSIISAFADQPDIAERAAKLREIIGLHPREFQRAIELGVTMGAIPGKDVGSSRLVGQLLDTATDPATQRWLVNLAIQPAMRSGISEGTLSAAFQKSWSDASPAAKQAILEGVIYGSTAPYPLQGSISWTQPETFVASVLRETTDPSLRLRASYAYLVSGHPATPDEAAIRAVSEVVGPRLSDAATAPQGDLLLPSVVGAWYSRFGSAADIQRLQALPSDFEYPASLNEKQKSAMKVELTRETTRAIDAIRLRSN